MITARRTNRVTLEKIYLENKLHHLLHGTVLRLAWEMPDDADASGEKAEDDNGEKADDSEAAGASDP